MSIWSTYGTDSDEAWVDVPDNDGNVARFKLGYVNGANSEFIKEFERVIRPHRRRLRKGQTLDVELQQEILVKVFAKTALLDWENIADRNGNPYPYSVDNAVKLLTELPTLFDILQMEAANNSNFQTEALSDEAKNL